MKFIGLSSSAQATRGYWRVTLGGEILDWKFFFSSPVAGWTAKVETWRSAVDAGDVQVAAITSAAAIAPGTGVTELYEACAVVDVHILGADQGDTVGAIVKRLSDLTANVNITQVELVNNSDPVARDAALQSCQQAQCDPICQLTRALSLAFKVAIVVAVVFVGVQLVKQVRK